jgi:hypothetical protein
MKINNTEMAQLRQVQQAYLSLILNLYGCEEYAFSMGWDNKRKEMMIHYKTLNQQNEESDDTDY